MNDHECTWYHMIIHDHTWSYVIINPGGVQTPRDRTILTYARIKWRPVPQSRLDFCGWECLDWARACGLQDWLSLEFHGLVWQFVLIVFIVFSIFICASMKSSKFNVYHDAVAATSWSWKWQTLALAKFTRDSQKRLFPASMGFWEKHKDTSRNIWIWTSISRVLFETDRNIKLIDSLTHRSKHQTHWFIEV